MTTYADSQNYTIADFVEDAQAMIEALGPTAAALAQAARLMRHLTVRDDLYPGVSYDELTDEHESVELYTAPDGALRLALVLTPPGDTGRVHSHGGWGVGCVYKGTALHVRWERRDDGRRVGYAEVAETARTTLRRGEAVWWLDPPDDLHSQAGQDELAAWELVLTAGSGAAAAQLHFDPATKRVWAGPPIPE